MKSARPLSSSRGELDDALAVGRGRAGGYGVRFLQEELDSLQRHNEEVSCWQVSVMDSDEKAASADIAWTRRWLRVFD